MVKNAVLGQRNKKKFTAYFITFERWIIMQLQKIFRYSVS
jgi:hypothetical protein